MKVLFTSPMMEYPPRSGPHLRIDNTIKALSQVSDLHILSKVPQFLLGGQDAVAVYKEQAKSFRYLPSVRGLSAKKLIRGVQKIIRKPLTNDAKALLKYANQQGVDAIWFGFGNISHDLIRAVHQLKPSIPLICDTDSVWSRFIHRELPLVTAESDKNEIIRATKAKEIEEKLWVEWCDITTAVSEVDAAYYRQYTINQNKVAIFPNAIDLDFYQRPVSAPEAFSPKAVILSGSFGKSTSPMNRAADWVLDKIWPLVKAKEPDAHLYIVGTYSDVSYAHINDSTISVMGRVPCMLPYLQHAKCAITPLQYESGTRFKILEAAACKLPMISTTLGAEGLNVAHKKHLLIADSAETFAQAIVDVLNNPFMAKRMAELSYELVHKDYSLPSLANCAYQILEQVQTR